MHHFFEFILGHPSVPDENPRFGHKLLDSRSNPLNAFDAVVQKVNLSPACHFALDCIANQALVVGAHKSLDRKPVRRRGFQGAHVFGPHERHVKRSWNRGGRQCEQVHQPETLLQTFLVQHSEALFLVNHHQTEILEMHLR